MYVKSHLTSGASVYPENTVTYSVGNGGPNICGVFSETALLRRFSTPSIESRTFGQPFSCEKVGMHNIVLPKAMNILKSGGAEDLHFSAFIQLVEHCQGLKNM